MADEVLIIVLSIEIVIVILCVIIALIAFLCYRRLRNKKPKLHHWPYILPLYFYLSYYDDKVDKLFTTEPRLTMFQGTAEPPDKVKPLVKLFIELEKEIEAMYQRSTAVVKGSNQTQPVYPEKVRQLYELEEMVDHYNTLREIYSSLEEDVANVDDYIDTNALASGGSVGMDEHRVQAITKGALLLQDIRLQLHTLLKINAGGQIEKRNESIITCMDDKSEEKVKEQDNSTPQQKSHRGLRKHRNILMNRPQNRAGKFRKTDKLHQNRRTFPLRSKNRNVVLKTEAFQANLKKSIQR